MLDRDPESLLSVKVFGKVIEGLAERFHRHLRSKIARLGTANPIGNREQSEILQFNKGILIDRTLFAQATTRLTTAPLDARRLFIEICYLAASALFILGLRGLTAPDKARRGMQLAAAGMLLAVIGTLIKEEIVSYWWIMAGLVVGSGVMRPARTSSSTTE